MKNNISLILSEQKTNNASYNTMLKTLVYSATKKSTSGNQSY